MDDIMEYAMAVLKPAADMVKRCEQGLNRILDPGAVILEGWRPSVQVDGYSCGAQSCFMILRHFGKARSAARVAEELGTDENGTHACAIIALLRKRGLRVGVKTRAAVKDLRKAMRNGCPVLVATSHSGGHWAVVYGFSGSCVYVSDPSLKRVSSRWSEKYFMSVWERWAATVSRRVGETRRNR